MFSKSKSSGCKVKFCPSCNHVVEPNAISCERCGADFGDGSAWKPTAQPSGPSDPTLVNSNPPSPEERKKWLGTYLLSWFLSYAAFSFLYSAAPALEFHSGRFDASQFFRNAQFLVDLSLWIMTFGLGLLVSAISLFAFRPDSGDVGVLWKRALVIALAPASLFLAVNWHTQKLEHYAERELLQKVVDVRNRVGQVGLAAQAKYVSEIRALDVPNMLAADTLVAREGIERNKLKLAQMSVLVERQAVLSRENMADLQRQLNNLIAGHPSEKEMSRSIDTGVKRRQDLEAKIFETQRSVIATLTGLNDFMGAQMGRVTRQGVVIRFETDEEAKKYNSFVKEVIMLAQLESDLLAQLQKMVTEGTQSVDQVMR